MIVEVDHWLFKTNNICVWDGMWTVKWGIRFRNARIIEDFTAWAYVNLFMPEMLRSRAFQIYTVK